MRSYLAWVYENGNGESEYTKEFDRELIKQVMDKQFKQLEVDIDAEHLLKQIEAEFSRAIRRT